MRFLVETGRLPWRARIALLLGGSIQASAHEHDGRLTIVVGVEKRRRFRMDRIPVWWHQWTNIVVPKGGFFDRLGVRHG